LFEIQRILLKNLSMMAFPLTLLSPHWGEGRARGILVLWNHKTAHPKPFEIKTIYKLL